MWTVPEGYHMCFAGVVLLNAKPVCKVDMPAGEAGWRHVEGLVVYRQLFAMVGPVAGIAGLEGGPLEEVPLPLEDKMERAQGLVVEN